MGFANGLSLALDALSATITAAGGSDVLLTAFSISVSFNGVPEERQKDNLQGRVKRVGPCLPCMMVKPYSCSNAIVSLTRAVTVWS